MLEKIDRANKQESVVLNKRKNTHGTTPEHGLHCQFKNPSLEAWHQ
jgi:hypothetical protein